jgi:hypothetical protein
MAAPAIEMFASDCEQNRFHLCALRCSEVDSVRLPSLDILCVLFAKFASSFQRCTERMRDTGRRSRLPLINDDWSAVRG